MNKITVVIRLVFLGVFLFLVAKGKVTLWLLIYGVSLIMALFFGRIYCGYLCPMNTIMYPAVWISKKLQIGTDKIPKVFKNEKLTWVFLMLTIGIMFLVKKILNRNIPILLIWLMISFLITLRYKPEFFHIFLCPFASLQKVFARKSKYTEMVEINDCIGCGLCQKVCPAGAIEMKKETNIADIDNYYCLQCKACESVCPKECISYKKVY
ncbi:MAG: 4Fe-4S binding protein [Lentihominibacter sp.]|jgi:ferredoxin-type protein NapH